MLSDADSHKETRETPTILTQNGQNPTGAATHDQPKAYHAKAVAKRGSQGLAAPRGAVAPLWMPPYLSLLWWWYATMLRRCSLVFWAKHRQNPRLHSCITRGVPPSLTHTIWASTTQHKRVTM